ncbi:flagellar motor protein MotB [Mobiluncus curtisii]|uniref:OmpA family protein n=1 Tax=Mobiluncus curtisii ATCC 51333 TaxID=887326 RepID=E6LXB8_9ACTO|nr:flagellar motor protein MotB [Mobiluncus curtisii]EFU80672.1 OmpA family protein [Mobiluncus curtisii ATCC 51333]
MAKRKHECPEPDNTERWAVSYLDMITVMMCLFLVLYAISQVDQGKLSKLRTSLAAGFNSTIQIANPLQTNGGLGILAGSTSAVQLGTLMGNLNQNPESQPERIQAMREASHLNSIKKQVEEQLKDAGKEGSLAMRITDKGLVLGMVANDTYFKTGDATIQPTAREVLKAISPTLMSIEEGIAIEGYADPQPIASAKFPSNYHLASARAIEVLIALKDDGVPGTKLRSISYGADHQTEATPGQDAWAFNRRVDIVIMSTAKDSVRALLPDAAKQLSGDGNIAPAAPQIGPSPQPLASSEGAQSSEGDAG